MKILCSICARGGSKGLKNKNLLQLAGKPLIAHSIRQAIEAGIFSNIAVSSDSQDILDVAKEFGADILIKRAAELATDSSGKLPAIQDCLLQAERIVGGKFEISVDLSCTAPLRTALDIQGCVNLLTSSACENVITGVASKCSPYFSLVEVDKEQRVSLSKKLNAPVLRRQDSPACYDMNGSIYVWWRDSLINNTSLFLENTRLFEMKREQALDIDDQFDFELVKFVAEKCGYLK